MFYSYRDITRKPAKNDSSYAKSGQSRLESRRRGSRTEGECSQRISRNDTHIGGEAPGYFPWGLLPWKSETGGRIDRDGC